MFGQSLLSGAFGSALDPGLYFNNKLYDGTGTVHSIGGKIKGNAYFNAATPSRVALSGYPIGNWNDGKSFSCWVNFASFANGYAGLIYSEMFNNYLLGHPIIYYMGPSYNKFRLGYSQTNGSNNFTYWEWSYTVTLGTWYHITYTGDDSTTTLYINGVSQGAGSKTSGSSFGTNGSYTNGVFGDQGEGVGNGWALEGSLDQARMFDSILTQAQVNSLHTETVTTASTLNFPSGAGCVAAYTFDTNGNDIGGSYNGTSSNVTYDGFLNFQPDLVWQKSYSTAGANHLLTDSVRGAPSNLFSNDSSVATTNGMGSLDAYGFTTQTNTAMNNDGNVSGQNYVTWNWKAGGSGSDNFYKDGTGYGSAALAGMNTGSLTPTKSSVNTESGFSIVTLNSGGSTADVTVSHGLGVKPAFVLFKKTSSEAGGWFTWHQSFSTESYYLYLQDNYSFSQLTQSGNAWGNQSFDTNNISFRAGWTIETNRDLVIYSFAEIAKYSKMGSYNGTGGTLNINCGFQPIWVMIKRTDSAGNWVIVDEKRASGDNRLYADLSNAQDTGQGESFTATGFSPRNSTTNDTNTAGGNYIYMAFAAALT